MSHLLPQSSQVTHQPARLADGFVQPFDMPTREQGGTLTSHVLADVSVGGQEWVRCSCGQWAREWLPGYEERPTECGVVNWRRAWSKCVGELYIDMVERAILFGAREQLKLDGLLKLAARG